MPDRGDDSKFGREAQGRGRLPKGLDGPWIDILDGLEAGVALCELDLTAQRRKLLWCNEALAALARMPRRKLLAAQNLDLLQAHFEPGGWGELYRQAGRGNPDTGVYRWRGEKAERWIAYRCVPVESESSGLCLVSFEREVTEEIHARRRMRLLAARLLQTTDEVRRDLARRLDAGPKPAADALFHLLDELSREMKPGRGETEKETPLRSGLEWAGRIRHGLKALLDEALAGEMAGLGLAGAVKRLARERRLSLPQGRTLHLRLGLDESRLDDLARRLLLEASRCLLHLVTALPERLAMSMNQGQAVLRAALVLAPGRKPADLEQELERQGLGELLSLSSGGLEVSGQGPEVVVRVFLPLPDPSR